MAAAAGLATAGLSPLPPTIGLCGLAVALVVVAGGVAAGVAARQKVHASLPTIVGVILIGLFSGLLLGSLRVASLAQSRFVTRVGQTVTLELVVTGPVRVNSGWQSANARVQREIPRPSAGRTGGNTALSPAGETVSLDVPPTASGSSGQASLPTLVQGQRVTVTGRLVAPAGPSPSGFDQATYLHRQGISVVLQADVGGVQVIGSRGGISGWFDRVRERARDHLSRGPDSRLNEMLQGVVMADKEGIDQGWLDAFRRSGTAHMLAVNGLHIGSLAALILVLARRSRLPRGVGFILAACVAVFMVPFTGASPSVVRASTMIVIVLLGRWLGRRRDQWQVLAFAAVVVLAPNPLAVFSGGFQLSFAAVAGVLALARPLERMLHRLPKSVASSAAVSLAATIGTAPVSLVVFGQVSLVSALANVLVVPLLPLILGLGMASVMLGFIWTGFCGVLDTVAAVPLVWSLRVAQVFAFAPVLKRQDLGRAVAVLMGVAAALPAALSIAGAAGRSSALSGLRSLRWLRAHRPRGHRGALVLASCALVVGGLVGGGVYPLASAATYKIVSLSPGHGWPDQVEVRVLDVGQGTGVLIRTPEHHALLFDSGPEDCSLSSQLRSLGVSRLDLVLISHPHADHYGGLLEALGGIGVATFVDDTSVVAGEAAPGRQADAPGSGSSATGSTAVTPTSGSKEAVAYLELRRLLKEKGARYIAAEQGQIIRVDGLVISLYVPAQPVVMVDSAEPWSKRGGPPTGDQMNAESVVAVVRAGPIGILLPGDAEADTLAHYPLPRADVMVVPHHGSRGGVSDALLTAMGSQVACVSVGAGNPYGHPAPETMGCLQDHVHAVFRTDQVGWVAIRLLGGEMAITTERKPAE